MSAPDFYFAINAIFRHLHDTHGRKALIHYWQHLGSEYYASRWQQWRDGGLPAIAADWKNYFEHEPGSEVEVTLEPHRVVLDIRTCPAIEHLRQHHKDIPDYFCEHCDYITTSMGQQSGHAFERTGGMGSCRQVFTPLTTSAGSITSPSSSPVES
jgi:hypothetical protein